MRMHECLRRSQQVALRRLKAVASAVNEDVTAGVQTRFLKEALAAVASLRSRASRIARAIETYRELASVTGDTGGD
jgi:hypothetical protein